MIFMDLFSFSDGHFLHAKFCILDHGFCSVIGNQPWQVGRISADIDHDAKILPTSLLFLVTLA